MNKTGLIIAALITMSPLTSAMASNVQSVNETVTTSKSNQPEASAQTSFKNLINAIAQNNYNQFIAQGDTAFKAAITKELFAQVNTQLSPRLKTGYSTVFLGKLKQQGYQVYLWKLTFKDGKDDVLAKLSLKNDKVGGFWLN